MKKFHNIGLLPAAALLLLAAVTLSSCKDDSGYNYTNTLDTQEEVEQVAFEVSISGSDKSNLFASVQVNTSSINNYVVGVVESSIFESSYSSQLDVAAAAVVETIGSYVDFAAADSRYIFSGSQTINLASIWELQADTSYNVVTFGVDVNGAVLTEVIGSEFATSGSGAFTAELYYATESNIVLSVEPDDTINNYMVAIYKQSSFVSDFGGSTSALAQYVFEAYVSAYGSYVLCESNEIAVFNGSQLISLKNISPLTSNTDYSIVIFGIDDTATAIDANITYIEATTSGQYSSSEEYSAWLGEWLVTSTGSYSTDLFGDVTTDGEPIEFYVTISEDIADYAYTISGWDLSVLRSSNTFRAYFDYTTDKLCFWSNAFVGYSDASDPGTLDMLACGLVDGYGNTAYIISGDYEAMSATMSSDSSSADVSTYVGTISSGAAFTITHIRPIFTDPSGGLYSYYYDSGYSTEPIGPYTMTRVGAAVEPDSAASASAPSMGDVVKVPINALGFSAL